MDADNATDSATDSATDNATDEELVRRYCAGDTDAYGALAARYSDRLFRLASVHLYDEQNAADVVQEVLLRGHRGLRGFRFRSTVFTWLYRSTRNVCHEFNRQRKIDEFDEHHADAVAGPRDQLDQQQAAIAVRQLVAALPQRQREVVLLRVFEGMSVRDAARALACREGTVKAHLHKAVANLRLDLGDIDE